MYIVHTDIKGYNSSADAAARKNPNPQPVKAGEYYMYVKYPNGYNGMYNITKNTTNVVFLNGSVKLK